MLVLQPLFSNHEQRTCRKLFSNYISFDDVAFLTGFLAMGRPAIVLPLIGETVTATARHTGHLIAVITTLAMMIGLIGYILYCSRERWGSHWVKYGPTYLVCVAAVFVI